MKLDKYSRALTPEYLTHLKKTKGKAKTGVGKYIRTPKMRAMAMRRVKGKPANWLNVQLLIGFLEENCNRKYWHPV